MKKAALLLAPCVMLSGCLSADPHNFACEAYLVGENESQVLFDYSPTPRIEGIRRFAGDDFKRNELNILGAPTRDDTDLFKELSKRIFGSEGSEDGDEVVGSQAVKKGHDAILILSGGGQWGAFGAGFLKAWQDDVRSGGQPQVFDAEGNPVDPRMGAPALRAVTGISTGALQAVFASIGDFEEVVAAYSVEDQKDVVIDRGIFRGAIRQGASLDTSPLVDRLRSRLCGPGESGFSCARLKRIRDSETRLLIGLVDGETGDLQVVDVTQMLLNHYPESGEDERAQKESDLADCVTGVAMASAAVPAQLRPVRIDSRAYVDGGVRAAVFSDFLGSAVERYMKDPDDPTKDDPNKKRPAVYVVRNGPTVIPPPGKSKDDPEVADVSEKPTILRIALRSYSAIVNQNEMSSVAELLRLYKSPIHFVSADGFHTEVYNPEDGCEYPPETDAKDTAFNPTFMKCLIRWGGRKYSKYGWTQIKDESGANNQAGGK